jgi:hypothetical protein
VLPRWQLQDLPAGDRAELASQCPGLAQYLPLVPDPRHRRGVRHTLTSLFLAAIAAVLAGAWSLTAVGEWVADAPPDEATIRRVLETVDAAALRCRGRYPDHPQTYPSMTETDTTRLC